MALDTDTLRIGRDRVTRVFRYLGALNQHRNPPKRQIRDQPWVLWFRDLPDHPFIRRGVVDESTAPSAEAETTSGVDPRKVGDTFVLKVRRPALTRAPTPPAEITEWLERGWEDPAREVRVRESRNELDHRQQTHVVRFDEDPLRLQALASWGRRRDEWARNERPTRQAMGIFEQLYELHSRIDREAERVELVLGEGILSWRRPEGGVYHPVLLQRVQLEFDPSLPEFTVIETDHEVELYSALFQAMSDVDGRAIARCREELEQSDYHPLSDAISGFLRRLVVQLSPRGEFTSQGAPRGESDDPRLGRDPVLFLRTRTLGFATAIESVLEDLQDREDLPTSLLNVTGIEHSTEEQVEEDVAPSEHWSDPEEILLGKPTNPEQIRIAERLEQQGCVLVQGPPGTGKTHTIANLIGHLLAHGKNVLVTAHTTKALRVLREHVVEQLRPLCVSVLESDIQSRGQLEGSVQAIVERLSTSDARKLEVEAEELLAHRKELLAKLRKLRQELHDARADEYRDVVVAGQGYPPSDAARRVTQEKGRNDWIPAPVVIGAPLPLSEGELVDLYRTNVTITREDEVELSTALPNPNDIMTPEEFEHLVQERERLDALDLTFRENLWDLESSHQRAEDLELLAQRLSRAVDQIDRGGGWKLAGIAAGHAGGLHRELWDHLLSIINRVSAEAAKAQETLLRYAPAISGQISLEEQQRVVSEILNHLAVGNNLGRLTLLIHPAWKRFIQGSRVAEKEPSRIEHFNALKVLIRLRLWRRELAARWDRQMASLGAPSSANFGEQVESACAQFSAQIQESLSWQVNSWTPLQTELENLGFRWATFLSEQPPHLSDHGELIRLRDAVSGPLQEILGARVNMIRAQFLDARLKMLTRTLASFASNDRSAQVVHRLQRAVSRLEPSAYREAFQRLVDLNSRRTDTDRRQSLLARLEAAAPGWASAIRDRQGSHGGRQIPGNAAAAWLWRQLNDELDRRAKTSLEDLQQTIDKLTADLRLITAELIDRRAWAAQVRRTTLSQRQALVGWLDTVRKIGKGTGRRVPRLRLEASRKMSECRSAVPVWIMPLSRVVEHFDPRSTRFDVVVIDEASQSDVMALLAFYLVRKVVVVGDHEQVSPSAVGQNLTIVQHLIDEHLQGIPNAILYDGQMSVYDLARQSFGGTICLLEHFRCVPEIIQFSNQLSYNWRIKPLRDPSVVHLRPHVIAYRVDGASAEEKVNREEAWTVASLVVAASEQSEYTNKTFGVVSLVGDDQALEIERLLRQHLPPEEYDRRRIICGNAAQFQGDERDVMFLSIVDTRRDGPLPLRSQPMFKQRFNVAASRARDQMWVIHSLDPRSDLKPGDLRRQLIEHAEDPRAIQEAIEEGGKRTESKLEAEVMRHLIQAGYRVHPQWRVGYYRIDLVVEGGGRRLAVECDGDRFHPIEKLPEDMARQAILERLGWTFVRVRGSQFFREPEKALKPVFEKLSVLEIMPGSTESEGRNMVHMVGEELKERVVRRAHDLRREWLATDEHTTPKVLYHKPKVDPPAKQGTEPRPMQRKEEDISRPTLDRGESSPALFFVEPYRSWTPRPLSDPRSVSVYDVSSTLTEIIEAEGPMLCQRAYRLYMKAVGIQGGEVEIFPIFHRAVGLAVKLGFIEERNEFETRDQINQIVRKAGTPPVVLRTRGNRTFDEIPPAEIGELMNDLRLRAPNTDDEELLQSVLNHFELGEMTADIQKALLRIKARYVQKASYKPSP